VNKSCPTLNVLELKRHCCLQHCSRTTGKRKRFT